MIPMKQKQQTLMLPVVLEWLQVAVQPVWTVQEMVLVLEHPELTLPQAKRRGNETIRLVCHWQHIFRLQVSIKQTSGFLVR
jgi:hypothetical protein